MKCFAISGLALAAVLMLIYILVVGWFQSFLDAGGDHGWPSRSRSSGFCRPTPRLERVLHGDVDDRLHRRRWIVVRNSIILVDFIELRVRDGMSLEEAVVDAGAVRFRPMALTAAAVIVGSAVILFDPIFQGLAISLMAGEVASLLLSRMTVPITYYLTHRHGARHDRPIRTEGGAENDP